MSSLKESVDKSRLPRHIAVIMDGNGRWAREQGQNRIFGHQNGVTSVRNTAEACAELGVGHLTLYAFSTENWQRPRHEVDALMELLVQTISNELQTLHDNKIALKAVGNLDQLPEGCYKQLMRAIDATAHHDRMDLILALSYSSRWDILNAVKNIAIEVSNGTSPDDINEDLFKQHLTTAPYPDPELLIRTSGEHRISNFLLWELAYTELYFCRKMWPDFGKEDLYEAIINYQNRERRFGKTSEQLKVNEDF